MFVLNTQKTENIQEKTPEILELENAIQKKKRKFFTYFRLFLLLLIVSTTSITCFVAYKQLTKQRTPPVVIEPPKEKKEDDENNNPITNSGSESWSIYKNDDLKVSFEYPKSCRIEETNEEEITRKVEIIYETSDKSGYIYRVSTFTTQSRNLDEIAVVKRESFKTRCPNPAVISDIYTTQIHDTQGKTFEVTNCDSDYKFTYVYKYGQYYELAQVYKGDLGFRQQYKMATEEILYSTRFYPEGKIGPEMPYVTLNFENRYYRFSFDHLRLNTDCCDIEGPKSQFVQRLVSLYRPETYIDKTKYDGMGFFVDDISRTGFSDAQSYIDDQKNKLVDDFKVVRGYLPKPTESKITIGEVEATVLTGYSWEGNTLIYVPFPFGNSNVLLISIKNSTGEEFERIVNFTLDSIKF